MDLADLIRRTRLDARLSQRDLARCAGTSQSALARYEGGHSQPSLTTLERIVRAAGKTLQIVVDDAAPDRPKHPVRHLLVDLPGATYVKLASL